MRKNKTKKPIKLPTHIDIYIEEDGTILIYDLLDDFVDIAYKINPDEKRINYLHRMRKRNEDSSKKDTNKILKFQKGNEV